MRSIGTSSALGRNERSLETRNEAVDNLLSASTVTAVSQYISEVERQMERVAIRRKEE